MFRITARPTFAVARRALSAIFAVLLLVLAPSVAAAQGTVAQSGPITQLHIASWFGNGLLGDGGTPAVPYLNALGLYGGATCPFGISSATTPGVATGQYASFSVCQTNTQTTFNFLGNGGLAAPNVVFNVGGTTYTFPFSGPQGPAGPAGMNGATGPTGPAIVPAPTSYPGAYHVVLAATGALPANTYNNGTLGLGATLTGNANGALAVDSVTVVLNDGQGYPERILVPAEAAPSHNGIYTVTQVGDGSHPYILTRAVDFDTAAHMTTRFFTVAGSGPTLNFTTWTFTVPNGGITVGSTALNFSQYTATTPLYLNSSNQIASLGWYMGAPGAGYPAVVGYPTYSGRIDLESAAGDYALVISTPNISTVPAFGLKVSAGVLAPDEDVKFLNATETSNNFKIFGDGGIAIGGANPGVFVSRGLGNIDMTGNIQLAGTTSIPTQGVYRSPTAGGGASLSANSARVLETIFSGGKYNVTISGQASNTQDFQIGPDAYYELTATLPTTATAANAVWITSGSYKQLALNSSSVRYKTGIEYFDASRSGAILDALKPILYTSLASADDPRLRHYGLLAEDVAKIAPELVNWIPVSQIGRSARVPDGYPSMAAYLSRNTVNDNVPDNVQYDRFIPLLIAEVKSLRARVANDEAEIAALRTGTR